MEETKQDVLDTFPTRIEELSIHPAVSDGISDGISDGHVASIRHQRAQSCVEDGHPSEEDEASVAEYTGVADYIRIQPREVPNDAAIEEALEKNKALYSEEDAKKVAALNLRRAKVLNAMAEGRAEGMKALEFVKKLRVSINKQFEEELKAVKLLADMVIEDRGVIKALVEYEDPDSIEMVMGEERHFGEESPDSGPGFSAQELQGLRGLWAARVVLQALYLTPAPEYSKPQSGPQSQGLLLSTNV